MGKQMRDGNLTRLRDAKLLVDAMRACDDASRYEFLLRLQRSYRQFGSLTSAMRSSITASSSA
jgi:hypothetical protein